MNFMLRNESKFGTLNMLTFNKNFLTNKIPQMCDNFDWLILAYTASYRIKLFSAMYIKYII